MLAWRDSDHSGDTVLYTPGTGPGVWQPTPRPNPNPPPPELPGLPAATPQWPLVTPFALTRGDQFRPGPPPALNSADYTQAFREVKALGGNGTTTPSTRTPEQTQIAFFWAGVGVSNAGVMIWNQIAQTVAAEHHLTLAENARLFAQMSVANADAFIAGFDAKYVYNLWRPVTAIRAADTDGNDSTAQDPTWTPLITTPNHPSYVSLHATQSMAAAQALAAFFGTDLVPFTATWAGVQRSFGRFSEAAKEAARSRIYAGIHWNFDAAAGLQQGRQVGQYVTDHYFRPLAGSRGGMLAAAASAPRAAPLPGDLTQLLPAAAPRGIYVRIPDTGGLPLGPREHQIGPVPGPKPDALTNGTQRAVKPDAAADLGADPFVLFSTAREIGGTGPSLPGLKANGK
jgi:hypothetical protein